jgi:hypothetical protein
MNDLDKSLDIRYSTLTMNVKCLEVLFILLLTTVNNCVSVFFKINSKDRSNLFLKINKRIIKMFIVHYIKLNKDESKYPLIPLLDYEGIDVRKKLILYRLSLNRSFEKSYRIIRTRKGLNVLI